MDLLPGLSQHGLGPFIDGAFADYAVQHEHDIHEMIDSVILNRKQNQGKGPSAGGGGRKSARKANKASSGGANTLKLEPQARSFRHDGQTGGVSRSHIEPILERMNSATTNGSLFAAAAKECRTAVQAIVKQCKASGKKYFDETFYFDDKNNLFPDGSPGDCTVVQPSNAARLSELYPGAPIFASDVSCDDVSQGQVGDCFLIGAISALAAANPQAVKNLFVATDLQFGVFGFLFFKSGGWEWVIVDDIIATEKMRSGQVPLYASCMKDIELWPMLLEKAYAKMHFNWDIVDGGWAKEALVDMTGGLPSTLDLYRGEKATTFRTFKEYVDDPYTILGCAVGDQVAESGGEAGGAGEAGAAYGLFHGHQYSVIDCVETSDGSGFVQVRNPWGNDAEWTGPYADNDEAWIENPKHKEEVNPTFAHDGAFWMRWEDFKGYLSCIDIVRLFPEDFKCLTVFGKGIANKTPENCYMLQVCDRPTPISIAFAQDDPKVAYDSLQHEKQYSSYQALKLSIFKFRENPGKFEEVEQSFQSRLMAVKCRERSVYHYATLDPGMYCIFPVVLKPKGKVGTYCRVFGPPDADYALWKFSEGEASKLSVGRCPTQDSGKEIKTGTPREEKPQQGSPAGGKPKPQAPSPQASPKPLHQDANGAPSAQHAKELTQARNDMQEAQNYIQELEKVIRKQQEDITALQTKNSGLQAAAQQRSPSPNRRRSPLVRLGMSQDQWEGAVSRVFREVACGEKLIDAETAVNAFRMIITMGADMDECFLEEHRARGGGSSNNQLVDLGQFSALSEAVLHKWHPLCE